MFEIAELLAEYDRARAYTDELWRDLSVEELHWRPHEEFSPIGWHLGHQAHVAHFMVRNLTAAEPSPMPDLDDVLDSANPERLRLPLPTPARLGEFRDTVAERVHARLEAIGAGAVGAPAQLKIVAQTLLVAIVNHEYQHDKWIGEVRGDDLARPLPEGPASDRLQTVDSYLVVCGWEQ